GGGGGGEGGAAAGGGAGGGGGGGGAGSHRGAGGGGGGAAPAAPPVAALPGPAVARTAPDCAGAARAASRMAAADRANQLIQAVRRDMGTLRRDRNGWEGSTPFFDLPDPDLERFLCGRAAATGRRGPASPG